MASSRLVEVVVMRWRSRIEAVAALAVGALVVLGVTAATERLHVPDVPNRVRATDGTYTNKIRVDWGDDSMAASWKVHRSETQNSRSYDLLTETTSRSFDDTDVVVGTTYWYKVSACNLLGCSSSSDPESGFAQVIAPDAAPTVSASDGVGFGNVEVTWTAVPRATEYKIYGASNANARAYDLLATVPSEAGGMPLPLVYNDAFSFGLGCRIVWYWVRGCNTAGCGPYSEPDSGFPLGMLPLPPGGVAVTASQDLYQQQGPVPALDLLTDPFARVTWTTVEGATHYRVYRETILSTFVPGILGAPGHTLEMVTSGAVVAEPTHTRFDDMDVAACQIYSYKVAACGDCGCGEYSQPARWTPQIKSAPTGVEATQGCSESWHDPVDVEITWPKIASATSYHVRAYNAGTLAVTDLGETALSLLPEEDYELLAEWQTEDLVGYAGSSWAEGIAQCEVHAYTVAACNCLGCGPESAPVLGWSCQRVDEMNLGHDALSASAGDYADKIEVAWTADLPTKTSYCRIQRSESPLGSYADVGTAPWVPAEGGADHSYSFVDPVPTGSVPAAYFYRIRLCNDCSCSAPSVPVAGYTNGYTWTQPTCSDMYAAGDPGQDSSSFPIVTLRLEFKCDGVTRVRITRENWLLAVVDMPTAGWPEDSDGWKILGYVDARQFGPGALKELGDIYTYKFELGDAFGYATSVEAFVEMPVKE